MRLPDFNIFAIKILKEKTTGQKILEAHRLYYLLQGYTVEGNIVTFDSEKASVTSLYDNYIGQTGSPLHVSISAIVGANGSGKSTIVEYILRLINNFAASLFGEEEIYPGAEHIHFIDNLFGEMYFMLNGTPHLLRVYGNKVELYEYSKVAGNNDDIVRFEITSKPLYMRESRKEWRNEHKFYSKWRKPRFVIQRVADHFFYTFVSNYSFYAYNSYDFSDEWNSEGLERMIRYPSFVFGQDYDEFDLKISPKTRRKILKDIKDAPIDPVQCCWLEGIFHKNDGYQTPIVLTPYRVKGNMDVNKEKMLSNERLLLLLLIDRGFRRLNNHLDVVSFTCTKADNAYGLQRLNKDCGLQLKSRAYRKLRNEVKNYWLSLFHVKISPQLELQDVALDYLMYKTFKVSSKYSQYAMIVEKFRNLQEWPKQKHIAAIHSLIDTLSLDQSHITTKIRRTLCYLTRNLYPLEAIPLDAAIKASKDALRSMREDYREDRPLMISKTEDTLPPPFISVSIDLVEVKGTKVEFGKLSSGEKQQIFSICSILYHLSNIGSVHADQNRKRVTYRRVNIILEEIELYYHPELQRKFITYLLDGLRQMRFSELVGLNIQIVTHSPFVLSDIPMGNIIAMEDGKPKEKVLKSFGANIHDLLDSNFFMQVGSRGEFANWMIMEIHKALSLHQKVNNNEAIDCKESNWLRNYPRQKLYRYIHMIDEPIVKRIFLDKFETTFEHLSKYERIKQLEMELSLLKEGGV